ncbi:hypothetical protein Leryth_012117 [Lithospermum erythrorhizon]|nr:hypothetical protein Leryth_012117 [Lithospermum erythrorhizon]
MSDIRKWFMKQHDKSPGDGKAPKPVVPASQPNKSGSAGQEASGRRKTSKYFASDEKEKGEKETKELPTKRKASNVGNEQSVKKVHKIEDDDDDDLVLAAPTKTSIGASPNKKLKGASGRGIARKSEESDESDEDDDKTRKSLKPVGRGRGGRSGPKTPVHETSKDVDEIDDEEDDKSRKSAGRGRGGRGASAGRGRGGGGRGGFMNFGERKDPPHKGEKEIPEGKRDCLAGLTFVISGTLDSLEREEAEDLIKRHGGRVTGSVSKKTSYLLCDEDIEGKKSEKAKELGTTFLTEDALFDMIRKSNKSLTSPKEEKKALNKVAPSPAKGSPIKSETTSTEKGSENVAPPVKRSPLKSEAKKVQAGNSAAKVTSGTPFCKKSKQPADKSWLQWTEKYRPKVPTDLVGNQSLVKQLHDWLKQWDDQFLNTTSKGKGKKQNDSGAKKAVLLSGTPGIGKTTSAKIVSQMLGFQAVEVNASDSRGKADAKIQKGIGGSTANSIKELVSNNSLGLTLDRPHQTKTVLIMDEVDGMSGGDRGGVADLIASIKISKIPIICICNDRYSQKLKSLVNYCLLLSFRKPTKQQMAKRLMHVAKAEGVKVNEIALEELASRVNGDMRMALNQLQYMSLSNSEIGYDNIRQRLQNSSKDEDISPFTAVDKLFTADKLRMDERIDLSMSDPDLVPLLIQENYINFRPRSLGGYNRSKMDNAKQSEEEIRHLNLLSRAADSIADGDIVNVQIRRYQRWQLSQTSVLASCIIPSVLLHGQRQTLEQGERNFNRFGGWLGKNSTLGKNYRLLEDLHVHLLASCESYMGRMALRLDHLTLLKKQLTDPLRQLAKDEAVEKVVEFMDSYSISQDDYDSIMEISKFQGHPNPLEGVQPAVKTALTKAYNKGSKSRVIRTADLITLPGIKKAPKKRIAAMLEPVDEGIAEETDGTLLGNEDENSSETEDLEDSNDAEKLQSDLQSLNRKGIQVNMDLKVSGKASAKKTPASRGKKNAEAADKKGGQSSGSSSKRKR